MDRAMGGGGGAVVTEKMYRGSVSSPGAVCLPNQFLFSIAQIYPPYNFHMGNWEASGQELQIHVSDTTCPPPVYKQH